MARESVVLLKNASATLPLNKAALKSIAVIGESRDPEALGGRLRPLLRHRSLG